ncbi:Ig-like domain-containing protein [Planctobacterium marinum]|uniref:Ig-like domain-containing protein n=1 Tax=Planctobacterium marinum TaxID=1631968 RepID=UPI001E400C5E|nr:Ig-like domain-containing protein [Planctobacterium marinum]MCC2604204.1 Ig-like domain-containing protein [Planctobacterium marinum]
MAIWSKHILTLLALFTLTACGGGGGGLSRDNNDNPTDPDTTSLSVQLTIQEAETGTASNQLSLTTPLSITATVTDADGNPADDELVTFSFNQAGLASFSPENGTALTNAQGVSSIGLLVGSIQGDGLVTAELQTGESAQIGFSSLGDASVTGKNISMRLLNTVSGEEDNDLASANPLRVEVSVTDQTGAPISDELVTFSLSNDALAFFDPASATALTEDSGVATINLRVGQVAGSGVVIATLNTAEQEDIGFNSAGDGQVVEEQPATLDFFTSSLLLASSGSDEVELIALVKDEDNILMEGIDVSFSSNSGELSIIQGTTQADGTARARLTSQNNPENRTITLTARAGGLSRTLTVDVTGTVVNINAPTSVILNDTGDISIIVADSDGNGIPNQQVSLSSQVEGALSDTSPVTDETGLITLTYNALLSGTDVITATALNASASQSIIVQEDEFSFARATVEDVPLNTQESITISWLKDNTPYQGGDIVLTTTRGTLSTNAAVTDENGQVTFTASSNTAGPAIISARGTDSDDGEVSARIEVEFIATEVASIIVSASPNSIGPGGQKSTITAVLRDPIGNLVKGVTVGFTAEDVSGGSLFPPAAVTDSNGLASTVFTSNTVTSEDAIVITATEDTSGIAASTNIAVANRALFISIGTGNEILSPTGDSYEKEFTLFVTDANSNPVPNVELTISGTPVKYTELLDPNAEPGDANYQVRRPAYYKGYWEPFPNADAFEYWVAVYTAACSNEDIDDDAILDSGEDTNGNGEIDPGNVGAIDGNVITDQNGQARFSFRYPKNFGAWATIKIVASTPVAGSENRSSLFHTLGVSAEDATIESTPPNDNDFGSGNSCTNTL